MAFKSTLLSSSSAVENTPSLMMLVPETEPVIEIDSDLRKITVPEELYNASVCGDHFAETLYFVCPRYFDGKDLSQHRCIIKCINAGNEYYEFDAVDMTQNDETLHFGWELNNRATSYSGIIKFSVQFETINDTVQYQWQTTPAYLNILDGLSIETTITEKDTALFREITSKIQSLQNQVDVLNSNSPISDESIDEIWNSI